LACGGCCKGEAEPWPCCEARSSELQGGGGGAAWPGRRDASPKSDGQAVSAELHSCAEMLQVVVGRAACLACWCSASGLLSTFAMAGSGNLLTSATPFSSCAAASWNPCSAAHASLVLLGGGEAATVLTFCYQRCSRLLPTVLCVATTGRHVLGFCCGQRGFATYAFFCYFAVLKMLRGLRRVPCLTGRFLCFVVELFFATMKQKHTKNCSIEAFAGFRWKLVLL
jgi:hypothetical protein